MEIIKRKVKQAVEIKTKIVDDIEYINIVPNLNTNYVFPFLLTSDHKNLGFFDVYDFSGETGTTVDTFNYTVTGYCDSRLYTLEKYTITNNIVDKYFHSTDITINGVNFNESTYSEYPMTIIYYVDGIKYVDSYIDDSIDGYVNTYFVFNSTYPNDNFINKPYYKISYNDQLTNKIKIESDIFIERQKISVFSGNMSIENIRNLYELKSYRSGNYYNINKIN
jgi:hypothetical protein